MTRHPPRGARASSAAGPPTREIWRATSSNGAGDTRAYLPLGEESARRHVLKHVLGRPSERWQDVLDVSLPRIKPWILKGTQRNLESTICADSLRPAKRAIDAAVEMVEGHGHAARDMLRYVVVAPEIDRLENALGKSLTSTEAVLRVLLALTSVGVTDETPLQPVGSWLEREPSPPRRQARRALQALQRIARQVQNPLGLRLFVDREEYRVRLSKRPRVARQLRDAVRILVRQLRRELRVSERKDSDLGRAIETIVCAIPMDGQESTLTHVDRALDHHAPGVLEAYVCRADEAVRQAGALPRHCVYDRKSYRENEVYIDDAGVLVSLSPEGRSRAPWLMRTAYRPAQGKSCAEKSRETADALLIDNPEASRAAIDSFRDFLAQHQQQGRVRVYYEEKRWSLTP